MAKHDVCPLEHAKHLDSIFRRLLQNPTRILRPYIRPGMAVLDFGCGPGFFTMPAASLVGPEGRVIAVDLQQGMLDLLKKKMESSQHASRISLHRCEPDRIGVQGPVDFAIAYHVVHEVPDTNAFFEEMSLLLKPGARLFVAEPKHHVDLEEMAEMKSIAKATGFTDSKGPSSRVSRTVLFTR